MKQQNGNINEQLANGKVLPLLIKMAIPVAIAQIVNALYSLVDRMYIGHIPDIGTTALTGLGITFPIIMIITAFSNLIGMGGAPLASIKIGERDEKSAQEIMGTSFTALLAVGAVLTVVFYVFKDPLLMAFGASEDTLPYASEYMGVYVLGTIFVMISLGMNSFINAQGFTRMGMATIVIGAIINIVLDPIFIFTLDMGVKGAALATIIAQAVSALWVVLFLCSKKTTIRIRLCQMRIRFGYIKSICALGVSSFTFQVNESIVQIVINLLLKAYGGLQGDLYIGSMTVITSVYQLFFMPLKGIVNGAQPIIGYNFGQRNYARIKETVHYERICSMFCAVVMWAVIMLFPRQVVSVFTPDEQLIELTQLTIRITMCTIFMLGMQMVNQNAFIAMGNAKLSFLFGIMRKLLILIPVALIMPLFFGVWGVYMAEAVANFVTTIITYIVFSWYMRKLEVRFAKENAELAVSNS